MSVYDEKIGVKYKSKDTFTNRSCGLEPGSPCYITFVDPMGVSFYAERRAHGGGGSFNARATFKDFGLNFQEELFVRPNVGYKGSRHADRHYPKDFLEKD